MAKMGSIREATEPHCIRALLVEFIVTFLFVFTGVASSMAADKVGADPVVGLLGVALTNTLVVTSMISTGHISGGHLNPAVTLGLLIGGHITFFRSILYWIHQLLASAAACYLLHFLTGGLHHLMTTPVHRLGYAEEVIWEIILTFSLLFSVYANMVHPKRGPHGVGGLGPILVGFVVGANILAAAAFSSASMNPARSFGPALVTANWTHHWVHWVGPLTGGGLAAFIYETFFVNSSYLPLPSDNEN